MLSPEQTQLGTVLLPRPPAERFAAIVGSCIGGGRRPTARVGLGADQSTAGHLARADRQGRGLTSPRIPKNVSVASGGVENLGFEGPASTWLKYMRQAALTWTTDASGTHIESSGRDGYDDL